MTRDGRSTALWFAIPLGLLLYIAGYFTGQREVRSVVSRYETLIRKNIRTERAQIAMIDHYHTAVKILEDGQCSSTSLASAAHELRVGAEQAYARLDGH